MIVTCPACATRYRVDDAALGGPAGRRVRCASCGNAWHYSAEGAEIQAVVAEVTAAAGPRAAMTAMAPTATPSQVAPPTRAYVRPEAQPHPQPQPTGPMAQPRPSVAVELPAAARRRRSRVAGLALIVLAALMVLVVIQARDPIVALWPAAAPLYAALHLSEAPGAGLEVTVTPTRTSASLVIDGDIVNSAGAARPIPRLRVTLRDGNKSDLDSKVIDPPVATLPPGATAHFNTVFEHPSVAATGVAVTFTTD